MDMWDLVQKVLLKFPRNLTEVTSGMLALPLPPSSMFTWKGEKIISGIIPMSKTRG